MGDDCYWGDGGSGAGRPCFWGDGGAYAENDYFDGAMRNAPESRCSQQTVSRKNISRGVSFALLYTTIALTSLGTGLIIGHYCGEKGGMQVQQQNDAQSVEKTRDGFRFLASVEQDPTEKIKLGAFSDGLDAARSLIRGEEYKKNSPTTQNYDGEQK
jgi:hypothetical protein